MGTLVFTQVPMVGDRSARWIPASTFTAKLLVVLLRVPARLLLLRQASAVHRHLHLARVRVYLIVQVLLYLILLVPVRRHQYLHRHHRPVVGL